VVKEIALKKRMDDDRIFAKWKEALEKGIEKLGQDSVETKVARMIDIELLAVLGKIQRLVGGKSWKMVRLFAVLMICPDLFLSTFTRNLLIL
jgi:hypothetical protein